jgi:hypothetical protein
VAWYLNGWGPAAPSKAGRSSAAASAWSARTSSERIQRSSAKFSTSSAKFGARDVLNLAGATTVIRLVAESSHSESLNLRYPSSIFFFSRCGCSLR